MRLGVYTEAGYSREAMASGGNPEGQNEDADTGQRGAVYKNAAVGE